MDSMSSPERPDSSRVVACRGRRDLAVEARPTPVLAAGDVLLRLRVCGLCGTDLHKIAHGSAASGSVLGHELVGSVVDVAGDARDSLGASIAVGERLVAAHHVPCGACRLCRNGSETMCAAFRENLLDPGGFSEYVRVRARAVSHASYRLPDAVRDESAVFVEPAACVLRAIDRSDIREDESVIIAGAGSMGLLHLLVLRAFFDRLRIVVVDPVESRLEIARRLGADRALVPSALIEEAAAASPEVRAGIVFDTAGGSRIIAQSLAVTRPGATIVLFAHAPEDDGGRIGLDELFRSERRIVPSYSGGPREQRRIFDAIVSKRLDPSVLVTSRVPLSRFDDALRRAADPEELKILIVPDSNDTRGNISKPQM
jgi:L-iditol 2-dehydrogenase